MTDPKTLVGNLRRLRRAGSISSQMNVAYLRGYQRDLHEHRLRPGQKAAHHRGRTARPLVTEEHVEKIESGEMTFADLVAMRPGGVPGCRGGGEQPHRHLGGGHQRQIIPIWSWTPR